MKVIAIIQARMGSTRLPGKVLLPLAGKSMLQNIIERVKRAKMIEEVVLAVPKSDKNLERWNTFLPFVAVWSPDCDESDLITRFYRTAKCTGADLIIRICSDNPLVEPGEIDRAIMVWQRLPTLFISNMHTHNKHAYKHWSDRYSYGYPDGIGCEVYSWNTLQWMNENLTKPEHREHPHLYFHERGEVESPVCPDEFARPDLKLDVNTKEEYEYIKDIYDYFGHNEFHITEVIKYLDSKN